MTIESEPESAVDPRIKLARFTKAAFYRLGLDRLVHPVSEPMLKLVYLARLSRWIRSHRPFPFNDDDDRAVRPEKRFQLYEHVFRTEGLDGPIDYLEFGVAGGESFRWWVEHNAHPDSRFFGFDTFTGLPEDFGGGIKAGTFSTGGRVPDLRDSRCRFEAGLFQETLGPFLARHRLERRLVVHADADLYTSTLYSLSRLAPFLKDGDILVFDEFGVPTHEFRAFSDLVASYRLGYRVLGAVNNYLQVAVRVEQRPDPEDPETSGR
jgi:hypothetical protein